MRPYLRLLSLALLGSGMAPLVTVAASNYVDHAISPRFLTLTVILAVFVVGLTLIFDRVLVKLEPHFDRNAREQAIFVSSMPQRYVSLAIFGAAAISIFLELSI